MNAIVIKNVTKHFKKSAIKREHTTFKTELVRWLLGRRTRDQQEYIDALRGVDLEIPKGSTVAIIGRNGSGKSTLLKLITGIYTPTSGVLQVNGRISALLDLGAGFHPDFSGRENILINGVILGMSRAEVRARMPEIIEFSELGDFIDEPVRTYSSGMYMRLAFAVATHVDPEILIIDEILAVGDEHFSRKSLAKMNEFKKAGKTLVLVTHDLETVQRWCDLAAWVDGGRIRMLGAPADVVAHYRQAVALAEAQGQPLTPPALSPSGGALPDLATATAVNTDGSHAQTAIHLSSVRLLNGRGEELATARPEEPLEIRIGYSCATRIEDARFTVAIERPDGTVLYATDTQRDRVELPSPLPEEGQLSLVLDMLSLAGGEYSVRVSAHASDTPPAMLAVTFSVPREDKEEGMIRPPHRWTLQETVSLTRGPTRLAR